MEKDPNDIFSLDRIIRQEMRKSPKSCPSKFQAVGSLSSNSSGAPGFVKGLYLNKNIFKTIGNVTGFSQGKAAESRGSSLSSNSSWGNISGMMEVGKSMGFEVNEDPRTFAQIVNRMREDKSFK